VNEIYLDHAASAPRRAEVLEAMRPFLTGVVGNPSGAHAAARRARRALEEAREEIAGIFGVPAGGVTFTAGGTESCHMALAGAVGHRGRDFGVVTSAVEHHAVLTSAERLYANGDAAYHREVSVDSDGVLDCDALASAIDEKTAVVSVMAANNETGVDQPLALVAEVVRRNAPDALLHTDAIAAAPWRDVATIASWVDMVSVCAHKVGGPVNAGALVATRPLTLAPVIAGGGQERGRRGGTVDVAAAVGLAAALRWSALEREQDAKAVAARRDQLADALGALSNVRVTASSASRLPGHCHVTASGVASDELIFLLDRDGICASAGASCSSGAAVGSHVLAAMGVPATWARGAVRFTLGAETTDEDVATTIASFTRALDRIRGGQ
jgi:cysteine desulfurase